MISVFEYEDPQATEFSVETSDTIINNLNVLQAVIDFTARTN